MGEDPKYTIKKIVDDITLKKDNEADDATLIFLYEGGPETLKELFASYDVVVTFGDAPVRPDRFMQDVAEHHPEVYPVTVQIIDKTGVTATKMMHKMKEQMRVIVEAAAQTSTYTLRIISETPGNRRVGGLYVWDTTYSIQYKDL